VASAAAAYPELIGRPRHTGSGVAHFHVGATTLTADVKVAFAHARDSSRSVSIHARGYNRRVISAVVLAAGKSTRMGRAKATLPLDEHETFITHIVKTFREAAVEDVVVVLGHGADSIADRLRGGDPVPRIVVNALYESGQFSSVLAGLNAVDRPGVDAMLLTLVDVPLVSSATVRAVVERFLATRAPVVRPIRGHEHGHPVLISRALFPALRAADPQFGAKPIVRGHASAAGDVLVEDAGAFVDVDTPGDYQLLMNGLRGGRL
jgi:molybdenum cofactor cytidylyltransferase